MKTLITPLLIFFGAISRVLMAGLPNIEPVMLVTADTPHRLMLATYHLGNRHVPLQIGDGWLKLEQDHVLKEMLIGLGVHAVYQNSPFEPEAGAYGGGHRHHHDDDAVSFIRPPSRLRASHD